uniref:Transposase MuDR plant domain-containing protein n=1 Tax=Ananas comosus var. bracteatus TaxID=296719 RepID=A0A6V7PXA2_ANACO|nr:unnamed protein product [Ananas comosus var. bracteatus]
MILEGEGDAVGKGDTSMAEQGVGMGEWEMGGKRGMGEQLKEHINNAKKQVKKNITEDEAKKDVDGQGKQVKQNANVVSDSEKGISEPHDGNISEGVEENKAHAEEDVEDGSESDSSFDEWSNFGDSDEDSINDSDFCINTHNVEEEDSTNGIGQGCPTTSEPKHADDNDKGAKNVEDNDQSSEYQRSEDLDSMSSSDEDGPSWPKYPVYNKRDLERTELKLGMKFASASEFRTVLRNHAISNVYDFNFVKNDGDRVTVKCKKDTTAQKRCEWRVHASWNAYEECFQIKSLQPEHKCGRQFINHQATSSWIVHKYLEQLRDDPKWGHQQ